MAHGGGVSKTFSYAGISDKGLVREKNEDAWCADDELGLFILSDGMGGKRGGGTAAKIVAQALPPVMKPAIRKVSDLAEQMAKDIVSISVSDLNQQVYTLGRDNPALSGMGATLVAVIIHKDKALIAHLGDSRVYLYREQTLTCLTRDHSIIQILLDNDEITEEEVATHPSRGQITRFIGMEGEAIPDITVIDLEPGDRILLCSDGLTGMVPESAIVDIFKKVAGPKVLCRYLLEEAISSGGKDNITAVVIDWTGEETSLDNYRAAQNLIKNLEERK